MYIIFSTLRDALTNQFACVLLIFLLAFNGCSTSHNANGAASPSTGNATSNVKTPFYKNYPLWMGKAPYQVVTVHVHYDGDSQLANASGSLSDNGIVLYVGVLGPILVENPETYHTRSLLDPFDVYWERLPGPLTVTFNLYNGGISTKFTTPLIDAVAGNMYSASFHYANGIMEMAPSSH
jgi:hypothetical protein